MDRERCDRCLLMRFCSLDNCLLSLDFFKRLRLSFLHFLGCGILLGISSNQIMIKITLSRGFIDPISVVFVKPFIKLNLLEI